jgi:hypothetical protein
MGAKEMAAHGVEQLCPDICNSQVILFVGAGASAPLGMKLMGPFMDLMEADMGSALLDVMRQMFQVPDAYRDLEILFETIEEYEEVASWCGRRPAWARVVKTQQFSEFMGDVKQIRKRAEDLLVAHYARVDHNSVVRHYRDFLLLLLESNSPCHLPIFTTNYDTAIEDFVDAAAHGFRLVDGFSTGSRRNWSPDTTFHTYRAPATDTGSKTVLLFKLHGSSTWRLHRRTGEFTKESTAEPVADKSTYENALVWPGLTKEIEKGPYETNYAYLEACLGCATLCVLIGFSFRDEVIRGFFKSALHANEALRMAIIDPAAEAIIRDRLETDDLSRVRPIVAKFGTDQLTQITFELSKLDFPWKPGHLIGLTAQPD